MVTEPAHLLGRIAGYVRDDLRRLSGRMQGIMRDPEAPGLYAWRFDGPDSRHRLHIRIHEDGSAVLFVNAVEAVHLSGTTAAMLRLALDETDEQIAVERLGAAYPDVGRGRLAADYDRVCLMAQRLRCPGSHCRACELGIQQPPPFSVRAGAPYKTDIALTYACNNNCSHCYNEPGRKTGEMLSLPRGRELLQRLWDIGVPYVIFTGGEPTLHPHLPELVAHAESLGQISGVNTNGRRLARMELVEALQEAGLDHVQITVASHRRKLHNEIVGAEAFEQTVAGIRNCLQAGLHVLTNTTLISDNVGEALDTVDFLHDLGLRTFAMNGMIHSGCGARHPSALAEDQLAPILTEVQKRAREHDMDFLWYTPTRYCEVSPVELGLGYKACNAAEYSICIEPDGDVLPCQSYYEPCGNIFHDEWEDIWNSPLFVRLRFRRERPERAGLPEECYNCEHLMTCGGGCPLRRRVDNGVTDR